MAVGYLLKVGDKTACGGVILTGDSCFNIEGQPVATESSLVSCGKHPGQFKIIGGVDFMNTPTGKAAGTLDSISSCPCSARFTEYSLNQRYGKDIQKSKINESYMPPSNNISREITQIYWSYGENNKIIDKESKHYVDLNLHIKTEGYLAGEKVRVNVNNEEIFIIIGSDGLGLVKNALRLSNIELGEE